MSRTVQIADALATSLGNVVWSGFGSIDVERSNWTTVDIEAMRLPQVYVTIGGLEVLRVSRGVSQLDYQMLVFVGRHVQSEDQGDQMLSLLDELVLYIRAHNWGESDGWPAGTNSPMAVSVEINPDDALNERNAWRAVVTVTYRVFEADSVE